MKLHSFDLIVCPIFKSSQWHKKGGEYENSPKNPDNWSCFQYRIDRPTKDSFGKLAWSTSLNYSSRPPPVVGLFCCCGTFDLLPSLPANSFFSAAHQLTHATTPSQLISVLQEVVPLVETDPTPLPPFPFKPPRKDSLVWRRATSTNIRGLSSLSPSWASTWCTGWSISPFRKRKDTSSKSILRSVN